MFDRTVPGICFVLLLLLTAPAALAAGGDDAPPWLKQAAQSSAPPYDRQVPAVVLLDESNMTVGENGTITTVNTYAVRILTREGRKEAVASAFYTTDTDKVRELRAWLIRPSGQVKSYGKDSIVESAGALNDVYNESQVKKIIAVDDADVGSVFGYQITTESREFFNQTNWYFQERNPVISSRITLVLPAGWRASSTTFNHAKVEPSVSGNAYTWELRNLPYIEAEPASPKVTNLAPRLAINYAPPSGTTARGGRAFENWTDVSRWYSELSDPQAAPDDALAAKARELTANSKTELERIRAIARYVQSLQYISIQMGVGRFRPHSAAEVFAKSYGDCKDKANLMRAMLRAVKLQAYPVLIYSGDPTYVREEWASPSQFNHCIIAIKVSDETQAPTVLQHPALGRLLIFDATDENTAVGDLPDEEQNSFALIAAGDAGTLLRMPVMPPETNRLERSADVVLTPEGSITVSLKEKSVGQSAVNERRLFRGLSRSDYTKMIEGWITRGASGAKISKVEPLDSAADSSFALSVEFGAESYAQSMQGRLLVFKPSLVSRLESLYLTGGTRIHPVILEAQAFTETVQVKLPAGFEVDEMPDALKLDMPFGNYATTYKVSGDQFVFTRTLTLRNATIPVDQYTDVRRFFERIRAAEQSPVVLARK
ncbi:MAG TPA: DUF3857 and transglutaminase domain-containing protein [Pyrinomonadaceae bacterium]|jgi:hypothetical protein